MEHLTFLVNSGEKLQNVKAYFHPDLANDIVKFSLCFGTKTLFITVNEDDSLQLSFESSDKGLLKKEVNMAEDTVWLGAANKPIRWGWKMVNSSGFTDGIQLEFAESVSELSFTLQFIAVASRIQIYEVSESNGS